jgi:hypothetical protein
MVIGSNNGRRMQPSMGVTIKTAKQQANVKQTPQQQQQKQVVDIVTPLVKSIKSKSNLVPFLDSIEGLLIPVTSSTFISHDEPKRRLNRNSYDSESLSIRTSYSSLASSQRSISPVSVRGSSRKQCIQVRSISVMNVSSTFFNTDNQF